MLTPSDRIAFANNGCLLIRDVVDGQEIDHILNEAQAVFLRQTDARGWKRSSLPNAAEILNLMARLFEESLPAPEEFQRIFDEFLVAPREGNK